MKLLSDEQIKEIEAREQAKAELEQQKVIKRYQAEQARIEQIQKEEQRLIEQKRMKSEPLYSMVQSLKPDEYLVMQYLNVNGKFATYQFKTKAETCLDEFWIGFNKDYEPYVTNGKTSNKILMSNVLGLEVRQEQLAEVVLIGGVAYKKMVIKPDHVDINFIDKTTKSYKGEWK